MEAVCKHHQECGGCSLWHLEEEAYYELKTNRVKASVERLGTDVNIVSDIIKIGEQQRRRAEFKISTNKGEVSFGFYQAKSHDVTDIGFCKIIDSEINALIAPLRELVCSFKKAGNIESIFVTHLPEGFDLTINSKNKIHKSDIEKIKNFAQRDDVLRMCIKPQNDELEIIFNANPKISFAGFDVELPTNSFLQASIKSQDSISKLVLESLKNSQNILDLFSGLGTYSFPLLANSSRVKCYEGDKDMVAALNNAARKYDIEDKLVAEYRDLFKAPLKPAEFKYIDGVVLNPPRAGAAAQCENLAKSGVQNIAMVSCNIDSFENDARKLIAANYELKSITPIDQFYRSNHLEIVANFILA